MVLDCLDFRVGFDCLCFRMGFDNLDFTSRIIIGGTRSVLLFMVLNREL